MAPAPSETGEGLMETPAWMEQCYRMLQALHYERLEVSGFLLGRKQREEMRQFFREHDALGAPSPARMDVRIGDFSFFQEGDSLWGKPIVWVEVEDCAVPLMAQGVTVFYDEVLHRNCLSGH